MPDPQVGVLGRIAGAAHRRRVLVLVLWLVAVVAAVGLSQVASGDFKADYTARGSDSRAAQDLLAERIEKARDQVSESDPGGRFLAVSQAYREWALADRESFTLVFGPALAGFEKTHQSHATGTVDGPDKAAALRAMDALRSLTRDADAAGTRRPLPLTRLPADLTEAMCNDLLHGADPATELAMVHCWASLHGFITLEVNGNLNWHGPDVREPMFLGLVRLLVALLGLPEPRDGWPPETPAP